jgi:PilZ domain-containing protein
MFKEKLSSFCELDSVLRPEQNLCKCPGLSRKLPESFFNGGIMTKSTEEAMEKTNRPAATAGSMRAPRHELHIPLRYRLEGEQNWLAGEAINMSESGLLFSSNEMLEVDCRVQITFQHSETPMGRWSTRSVRVVRRNLANWPETRILFGAKFCG